MGYPSRPAELGLGLSQILPKLPKPQAVKTIEMLSQITGQAKLGGGSQVGGWVAECWLTFSTGPGQEYPESSQPSLSLKIQANQAEQLGNQKQHYICSWRKGLSRLVMSPSHTPRTTRHSPPATRD